MAILDVFPESPSLSTSPRLSFSHDLHQTDAANITSTSVFQSSPDYDFCFSETFENEPSSADELFSEGLIRPVELPQRFVVNQKQESVLPPKKPVPLMHVTPKQGSPKEIAKLSVVTVESEEKQQSKSFWHIKRSSSVHCDNSYKKSSFWSSLPLLSRSNSTGSVPSSNKQTSKERKLSKNPSMATTSSSSSSSSSLSSSRFSVFPLSQKPPLRKSYGGGSYGNKRSYGGGSYGNPSPVLNVPSPFISKGAANLLGLGSFFRNGKDKKNKK